MPISFPIQFLLGNNALVGVQTTNSKPISGTEIVQLSAEISEY